MHSKKLAFIYALLVWAIPFVAAMFAFTLRNTDRAFFESIMAVAAAVSGIVFAILYFKKTESGFLKEGIWLGIIWNGISFEEKNLQAKF
jgi:ABC-type methionine transport system permease subunit